MGDFLDLDLLFFLNALHSADDFKVPSASLKEHDMSTTCAVLLYSIVKVTCDKHKMHVLYMSATRLWHETFQTSFQAFFFA